MELNLNKELCPLCHQSVSPDFYFCPNCGHDLKEGLKPVAVLTQIALYALAIFLPPFGLLPGIKYALKPTKQAKLIGMIIIILTLLSFVLTVWWTVSMTKTYFQQYNELLK